MLYYIIMLAAPGSDSLISSIGKRDPLFFTKGLTRNSFWIILGLFLIALAVWIQFFALDSSGDTAVDLLADEIMRDSYGTSLQARLAKERAEQARLEQEKRESDIERREARALINRAESDLTAAKKRLR